MNEQEFVKKCKSLVSQYTGQKVKNIYVVWLTKVLQNNKALLATNQPDNLYFEITHNGDKGDFYFDAYRKFENIAFKS